MAGNEGCWDAAHTFERCCGKPRDSKQKQVEARLGVPGHHHLCKRLQEDCRESANFNSESCCDLLKGDNGDEAGFVGFLLCSSETSTAPPFWKACWSVPRAAAR